MAIAVHIVDGPLPAQRETADATRQAGAVIVFEGVVRPQEHGRDIAALDYTAYQPMAEEMLARIGRDTADRHGLLWMTIEHSRGHVPAGAVSFRLSIAAAHRREAIAAMDEFINLMKRDVPIWKRPIYARDAARETGHERNL